MCKGVIKKCALYPIVLANCCIDIYRMSESFNYIEMSPVKKMERFMRRFENTPVRESDKAEFREHIREMGGINGNGISASPLAISLIWNNTNALDFLIEEGANINRTRQHRSLEVIPLRNALINNYRIFAIKLIMAGADITFNDNEAIKYAIEEYDLEMAIILIRAGADINAQDPFNKTALMLSCYECDEERYLRLIEMGANPNLRDNLGRTAMDILKKRCPDLWDKMMKYNLVTLREARIGNEHIDPLSVSDISEYMGTMRPYMDAPIPVPNGGGGVVEEEIDIYEGGRRRYTRNKKRNYRRQKKSRANKKKRGRKQ